MEIKYPLDPRAQVLLMQYFKKRKDVRKSMLTILYQLQKCSKSQDKDGFFDVPSTLMKSIRTNYKKYINQFKKAGIIEPKSRSFAEFVYNPNNLFHEEVIVKESYSTYKNQCKKYRFLIDPSYGYKTINLESQFKPIVPWYLITERSLKALKVDDIRIGRDQFARRLHHNLSARVADVNQVIKDKKNYKNYIRTYFLGYYSIIDAIACQPTLLPEVLNYTDPNYREALDSGDFYIWVANALQYQGAQGRDKAKRAFNLWAMNPGYIKSDLNALFPKMTKRKLQLIKQCDDKKIVSRKLQSAESKYFIDGALNNIEEDLGIHFAVTIHDSLIVENKNVDLVKQYLLEQTPFQFSIEKLG
jgi:hypothetical protein